MDDSRHDPDLARLRPVLRQAGRRRGHTGGTIAFRRANGWASVTNFGAEPAELPAGDILLVSGPLTDDGRLPQDTTAWIALG